MFTTHLFYFVEQKSSIRFCFVELFLCSAYLCPEKEFNIT